MVESNSMLFQNFDLLPNPPSDHHYLNTKHQTTPTLSKAINKEWKILQNGLPDSIFVRAYESKTHLMRAVIIGPPGTPYADGLFFFDILLPTHYPLHPPQFYFHSYGLDLNPNLYESGFVCLSLLNTWRGSKEEKWCRDQSTILQVLVSIQGLVLNEEPSFNEPYMVLRHWSSQSYKNRISKETCKLIIKTMRRRPKGFEDFVERHFGEKGDDIFLINFRSQLDNNPILFIELANAFEANGMKLCEEICADKIRKEEANPRRSRLVKYLVLVCLLLFTFGLCETVLAVSLFL